MQKSETALGIRCSSTVRCEVWVLLFCLVLLCFCWTKKKKQNQQKMIQYFCVVVVCVCLRACAEAEQRSVAVDHYALRNL